MVRRFSKQPTVSSNSTAPVVSNNDSGLSPEVQLFKNTYVFERRVLEKYRTGKEEKYKPSSSYDGVSKWNTPEVKKPKNAWEEKFKAVQSKSGLEPSAYLRILFKVLRGSSIAIPTVTQLASSQMVELVSDFLGDHFKDLRSQFVAESQRAQQAVRTYNQGAGYSLGLSVYYAILDAKTGLSPLFKYCLATETSKRINQEDPVSGKLFDLAKEYELLAAMDYTLFPKQYDEVWGEVIPEGFRVAACKMLNLAMER